MRAKGRAVGAGNKAGANQDTAPRSRAQAPRNGATRAPREVGADVLAGGLGAARLPGTSLTL